MLGWDLELFPRVSHYIHANISKSGKENPKLWILLTLSIPKKGCSMCICLWTSQHGTLAHLSTITPYFFCQKEGSGRKSVSFTVSTMISILSGTQWAPENTSWIYGYRNGWHWRNTRTKVRGTHTFLTCTKQRIEQTVEAGDTGTLTRHGEKPKHRQLLIATNGRIWTSHLLGCKNCWDWMIQA